MVNLSLVMLITAFLFLFTWMRNLQIFSEITGQYCFWGFHAMLMFLMSNLIELFLKTCFVWKNKSIKLKVINTIINFKRLVF